MRPVVTGLPVYLAPVTGAAAGDQLVLDGAEGRHAVVVRRTRVGERIALTDGEGVVATCVVATTAKASLTAEVVDVVVAERPTPAVTVVQAIPKGERAERTVEVLTEVGVDRIVPWAASRSVGTWRGERAAKSLARWRATAREAAKQSRRAWHPDVAEPAGTAAVAELLGGADLAVVLHESATGSLAALPVPSHGSIVVVVGPEGGLTDEELAQLSGPGGAEVVGLGETVLRTSTAGVAAVAAILSRTPRWD